MRGNLFKIIPMLVLIFSLTSCVQSTPSEANYPGSKAAEKKQDKEGKPLGLVVSAASSLTDALNDIAKDYNSKNPEINITFNFGSSGALQKQIEQGAPADIFFSAAERQITELDKKGLILEGTKTELLENRIVLVIPKGEIAPLSFEALNSSSVKKLALGEPNSVPIGQYSQEILKYLKIFENLKSGNKLVYAGDARQVLAWVESGNANAGLVYESDAIKSRKAAIVAYAPRDSHEPVKYPAAVIKTSKNPKLAKEFIRFLSLPESSEVFKAYGFITK